MIGQLFSSVATMSSPKRLRAAARVSETRRGRASGCQHGSVVSSHVVDRYDNPQRIKDVDDARDATYDEQGSGRSREQLHSSRRVASRDACPLLPSDPRCLEPLHAAQQCFANALRAWHAPVGKSESEGKRGRVDFLTPSGTARRCGAVRSYNYSVTYFILLSCLQGPACRASHSL